MYRTRLEGEIKPQMDNFEKYFFK